MFEMNRMSNKLSYHLNDHGIIYANENPANVVENRKEFFEMRIQPRGGPKCLFNLLLLLPAIYRKGSLSLLQGKL